MFGSGRVVDGVILAAPDARATASLAAVLAIRSMGGAGVLSQRAGSAQFVFAAAGGGPGSAASIVATGLSVVSDRIGIDQILDQPVVAVDGSRLQPMPAAEMARGRVNVLACPEGLIDRPVNCRVRNDPRGDGIAVGGVR